MENNLKKEFNPRDVQRMRNIITGDTGARTQIQTGWEKKSGVYKEGDVWEVDGKKWTIKNGIKQTVTKLDEIKKLIVMPFACPSCGQAMKIDDYNKKMWSIHQKCFDCVIEMEAKIKLEGKWDEYERGILNANKNANVDDFEKAIEEFYTSKAESYITEQGDIETWSGGKINEEEIKQVKEYIKKLRETEI